MNYKNLRIFCIIILFIVNCMPATGQQLSAPDFAQTTDTATNAVLLDVRTPKEFNDGHIKNALNIDFRENNFANRIDSLDKNKTVYIYCQSGNRSAKAASLLRSRGFSVYELEGGILKWKANNLPVETIAPEKAAGMSLDDYVHIINSHSKVLIDFYAEWCVPCKLMEPYMTELQKTQKGGVKVVRVDVDKNPQLAKDLKIDALPVTHYYKDGDLKWGYVGYLSKKALMKKIKD